MLPLNLENVPEVSVCLGTPPRSLSCNLSAVAGVVGTGAVCEVRPFLWFQMKNRFELGVMVWQEHATGPAVSRQAFMGCFFLQKQIF